jgi:hypothetical protein
MDGAFHKEPVPGNSEEAGRDRAIFRIDLLNMDTLPSWSLPRRQLGVGFAVVSGSIDQTCIDEAPGEQLAIQLQQHVGVLVIPRGSHYVVLRAEGVGEVHHKG